MIINALKPFVEKQGFFWLWFFGYIDTRCLENVCGGLVLLSDVLTSESFSKRCDRNSQQLGEGLEGRQMV